MNEVQPLLKYGEYGLKTKMMMLLHQITTETNFSPSNTHKAQRICSIFNSLAKTVLLNSVSLP